MANQVAARLGGDEYQHLTTWLHVLELLMKDREVTFVSVEDETAGSMDDVTVRYGPKSTRIDQFIQIKYHVDQRAGYDTDTLFASKDKGTSLLQKMFATWRKLKYQVPDRDVELHFVSNWSWNVNDKVGSCIDGSDNCLSEDFFNGSPKSDLGKIRILWIEHLKTDEAEFASFARCLRFDLGSTSFQERLDRVSERMAHLGLRSDPAALLTAVGIVRNWIQKGTQVITRAVLDDAISINKLHQEVDERSVVVYLSTIKSQKFDVAPDFLIDWREYFEGPKFIKGHSLRDPASWNGELLDEIRTIEARIGEETGCRLIRARGLARLSPWFGFGHVFSEVAGYTIEVSQGGHLWRTDATPSADFLVTVRKSEQFSTGTGTLAVGISVSGDIELDVRKYVNQIHSVSALLLLDPSLPLGRECFRNAGDVVKFARETKRHIREEVARNSVKEIQIFYYGPLSGAAFLGHSLNAMGAPVQIMEDQSPGYAPSFLLQ